MNYDAFKSAFIAARRESGLPMIGLAGHEKLDPSTLDREYVVYVEPMGGGDITPPFHVSAAVSFRWDALLTARTTTIEEDVLTEMLGRETAQSVETEQPWIRVDITLRAGLDYGTSLPMPSPDAWARWNRETAGRLDDIERIAEGDVRKIPPGGHAVLAWQGAPEIKVRGGPGGQLRLEEVEVAAFQGIDLPRQWDDPGRIHDDDPGEQLAAMFKRVKAALFAWGEMVDHLLPHG